MLVVQKQTQVQTPVAQKEKVVPLSALVEYVKEKFGVDTHVQRGTSTNGSNWVLLIPTEHTLGCCEVGVEDKDPEIISTKGVNLDTRNTMFALIHEEDMFDKDNLHLIGMDNFFHPKDTLLSPEDLSFFETKSILA